MISVASIVITVTNKSKRFKSCLPLSFFLCNPRGLPLPISVPGPREAVHGPSGHFLWYFWPPPLMVLLATPAYGTFDHPAYGPLDHSLSRFVTYLLCLAF